MTTTEQPYHPAEHTVDEVNEHLDEHPDDVAAVLALEAEAETPRKGIVHGRHGTPEPSEPADEGGTYDEAVEREDTASAFIIPNHNTIPQGVQDEDAAARNQELEDAGVNDAQGFIGTDGAANLLG